MHNTLKVIIIANKVKHRLFAILAIDHPRSIYRWFSVGRGVTIRSPVGRKYRHALRAKKTARWAAYLYAVRRQNWRTPSSVVRIGAAELASSDIALHLNNETETFKSANLEMTVQFIGQSFLMVNDMENGLFHQVDMMHLSRLLLLNENITIDRAIDIAR